MAEGSGVRWLCKLVFTFGAALILFAIPKFAAADFDIPPSLPSPSPDIYAEHAGAVIANESPRTPSFVIPTISGGNLDAINTLWTVETKPWHYVNNDDVPSERAVWAMFRGKQGELDGVPQEGVNYVLTHHDISSTATSTASTTFGLSAFGDPDTPSGAYTIVIAQIPESKFVVTQDLGVDENGIQTVEGFDAPYTDQDFINWFAGTDTNGTQPEAVRMLEFTYVAGEAHVPCSEECYSNVLFLPGIESSRLYRPQVVGGDEQKIWEPGFFDNLHDLFLTSDGKSVRDDVYAKEGDILDETPVGTNIYKSFIAKMDDLKEQGLINDWEAAAYDWRLSLDDILASGNQNGTKVSYLEATNTPYIIQELKRLAATSKSGKVTIVAHSNGGLVAKRLTEVLGANASTLIDRMVFVAVPQAGTPDAVAIGLHGEEIGAGLAASKSAVRTFASTSPMMYHLLPSAQYFTQVDDPVVTFDPSLPEWIAKYGAVIHSEELLHTFLTDSFGRVDAETGDTNQPIQLTDALLSNAEVLHADLDTWRPPAGVELVQIAGWGVPTTVSGITYKKGNTGISPEPNFTVDGDGTVVVPSALWTSASAGASNYWVDLQKYNKDSGYSSGFGFFPFNHSRILEAGQVISFVSDIITSNTKSLGDYVYFSTTPPPSAKTRLRYALHSPLTLDLYDDLGNHTGIATSTGEIEENIPGTYYVQFGDVKYIFADSGAVQHIIMSGYDTGTFTFEIGELQGDTVVGSITFQDIPVTPQTKVRFDVSSGIDSASDLSVDENGDGTPDSSYASSTGQLIVPVQLPVVLQSGGGGGNGPPVISVTSSTSSTSVTSMVASSTEEAQVPKQGIATSSAAVISEKPPRKIAQSTIKTVVKKISVAASTSVRNKSERSLQVAAVSQNTGNGLWGKMWGWIMGTRGLFRP